MNQDFPSRKKALIIEDDLNIVQLVRLEVADLGYELEDARDGETGLEMALIHDYAFVLLDIMLPKLEGVEVLKQIRNEKKRLPVLMLTARKDDTSKVLLRELGADDFISKPFNSLELKARIKSVLRRWEPTEKEEQAKAKQKRTFTIRDLTVDFEKCRIVLRGEIVTLTSMEFQLISLLASEPGRPFSRSQINEHAFGYSADGYNKSVTSHINRLRQKIEEDRDNPTYILTARGIGYYIAET